MAMNKTPTSRDPSTGELLARARRGDENAVDAVLERHRKRLRTMVAMRMDRRLSTRVDPSDVVQESLAVAAKRLGDYFRNPDFPFYVWLRELAWQRLIDLQRTHLRAKRRSVSREERGVLSLPDESVAALAGSLVDAQGDPHEALVREELRARVRAALGRLPDRDREVLVLRHLEQLATKETAAALGIREGAVKVRLLRSLKRMRELLVEGDASGNFLDNP
jgi:RNA polymerase sigma-70 factor (ECF subfamily)